MYKVIFYVPLEHSEKVKMKMFEAGGGLIGNYDCCSFETIGIGQFRPLDGSRPFIGNHNIIEKVYEAKVEMVVSDNHVKNVIAAMKSVHPYETPAYQVIKCEEI